GCTRNLGCLHSLYLLQRRRRRAGAPKRRGRRRRDARQRLRLAYHARRADTVRFTGWLQQSKSLRNAEKFACRRTSRRPIDNANAPAQLGRRCAFSKCFPNCEEVGGEETNAASLSARRVCVRIHGSDAVV